MATYLLLWNPDQWSHDNIVRMILELKSTGRAREPWRFNAHKKGKEGDEVFLVKTGAYPKGIFGHGVLFGDAFREVGSDGKEHWMFNVEFDALVDPQNAFLIPHDELRTLSSWPQQQASGQAPIIDDLAAKLRELAGISTSAAISRARASLEQRVTAMTSTEREGIVRQRIGQEIFRNNLLVYWDSRCCISGLAQPELLRASHIRPWAKCETDDQRLDVFNGLLLAAHLDAAFDAGFFTLNENGIVQTSSAMKPETKRLLGLDRPTKVRGITSRHRSYLEWHRRKCFLHSSSY